MSSKSIDCVDVVCGLAWGDEAKGKIVSSLLSKNKYDWVCRWSGGSNAGHTIYVNGNKYVTHIVPAGIFHNIPCYIGPDCYVNLHDLDDEMEYLAKNGFNIDLIKVSGRANVITKIHKEQDAISYKNQQGSTGKGIAPCARDKFGRIGERLDQYVITHGIRTRYFNPFKHIWDDNSMRLRGNLLCEGAQGFWLDINQGCYPYVTSSNTLPYSACSLGFPPQKIRHIYGAAKIYDTRVGTDPSFPENMSNELLSIAEIGAEFGATTGRARKVWWLNINRLIEAINITGSTHIVISKTDVLDKVNVHKLSFNDEIIPFNDLNTMKKFIYNVLKRRCELLQEIIFSDNPKLVLFTN